MAIKKTKRINVVNAGKTASVAIPGKFNLLLTNKQIKSLQRTEDWLIITLRTKPPIKLGISADDDTLVDLINDIPMS